MKTEELLLIGLALGGAYLLLNKKQPVVTTVQAPAVAPTPANSPAYGFPSNMMATSPFATGGYPQRSSSAAQDAAAIITAVGGVAKNVSDIVSTWT